MQGLVTITRVDNSTLERTLAGILKIKDGGVQMNKLNSNVVDGITMELSGGKAKVKPSYAVEADAVDYSLSSTIVGWSSFTAKKICYKKIGKLLFVYYAIGGTSDNVASYFTVPFTKNLITNIGFVAGYIIDNGGVAKNATISLNNGNGNIVLYPDVPGSNWTNSGTKYVTGFCIFEVS